MGAVAREPRTRRVGESTAGGVAPGEAAVLREGVGLGHPGGRRVAAGETAAAAKESHVTGGRVPRAAKEGASYVASARAPERVPSTTA
ncbi:UNVERIFIED_CONTAM: hypothetical protein FKN15_046632 [Acipenser sinensis]